MNEYLIQKKSQSEREKSKCLTCTEKNGNGGDMRVHRHVGPDVAAFRARERKRVFSSLTFFLRVLCTRHYHHHPRHYDYYNYFTTDSRPPISR